MKLDRHFAQDFVFCFISLILVALLSNDKSICCYFVDNFLVKQQENLILMSIYLFFFNNTKLMVKALERTEKRNCIVKWPRSDRPVSTWVKGPFGLLSDPGESTVSNSYSRRVVLGEKRPSMKVD